MMPDPTDALSCGCRLHRGRMGTEKCMIQSLIAVERCGEGDRLWQEYFGLYLRRIRTGQNEPNTGEQAALVAYRKHIGLADA